MPTAKQTCFRCDKKVGREWQCFGCMEYVCDQCDINEEGISGVHDVWDHFTCKCNAMPPPSGKRYQAGIVERRLTNV